MLSKEEVEDSIENKFNNSEEENFGLTVEEAKHIALYEKKIHYCDELIQATYNILLQYIEQLETKEQKLIEKLKNDIQKANEMINDQEYQYIDEVIDEQWERRKYAQEILKIVKGENE